jgi:hypothetical protein
MDHAEAREALELAAVEPDGFERLFAGDTPEAAALAGHLAGCDECSLAFERIRREAAIVRDVIRTTPPPELRERTLAYVAAVGRPRSANASASQAPTATVARLPRTMEPDTSATAPAPREAARPVPLSTVPRVPRTLGWVAALAAAIVVAVAGTGLYLNGQHDRAIRDRDAALAQESATSAALARVAAWTLSIGAEPDARTIKLASPTGAPARGSLVFSRSSGEVVVLAEDLQPPPDGRVLGCWVEVNGQRQRVGQMFFGGGVSYWAGPVTDLASIPDGARFGVSLDPSGTNQGGEPVLVGTL